MPRERGVGGSKIAAIPGIVEDGWDRLGPANDLAETFGEDYVPQVAL